MIKIERLKDNFFKQNTNTILKNFYNNYKKTFLFFDVHGSNILKNKNNVLQALKYRTKKNNIKILLDNINKKISDFNGSILELELSMKIEKKLIFQNSKFKKLKSDVEKITLEIKELNKEIPRYESQIYKIEIQLNDVELHTTLEELNNLYNINNDFVLLFELLENKNIYLKTFAALFVSLCLNAYNDKDFIEKFNTNIFFQNYNDKLTVQDFLLSNEINLSSCFE